MPPPPDPRVAQILTLLRQERVDQAAAARDELLAADPDSPQSRFVSALVDRLSGRLDRAVETLGALHAEHPAHPAFRAELATTRVMAGRPDEALPVLEEIARTQPNQPFAHFWIGQAHLRAFRGDEAARAFERVRQLNPADRAVLRPLASAHLTAGRGRAAEECCRELLAHQPDSLETLGTLAAALEQQDRAAETRPVYERMLEIDGAQPLALAGLARVLQTEGARDEARALLDPHLDRDDAHPTLIATHAGLCATPEDRRRCIDAARRALEAPTASAQERAGLLFAAARLLEAEERHGEAFEMYRDANALYPPRYDRVAKRRETDDLLRTFTAESMRTLPRASDPSTRPVFIVGMPRSGTTLVEQILGAHPSVHAAGELQEMGAIWRDLMRRRNGSLAGVTRAEIDAAAARYLEHLASLDADAPLVTDKMPHNFERLGLIGLLFPGARVIHCTRDPLDTCLSCFATQFGPAHAYSNDLRALGHAYGEYRRLMRHWSGTLDTPTLEVSYEETVADTERAARRIVEFVGLPWDDACLRFYESRRAVTTASVDQVRRPIYSTSVGRWRRFEPQLAPLADALRDSGVDLDA